MYRNISIMLFVLFAVVLGVPASQEDGSTTISRECRQAISVGANIYCRIFGYSFFTRVHPGTGELGCDGGDKKVKLPKYVWPSGSSMFPCSPTLKATLQEFSDTMQKIKDSLKNKDCNLD